MPRPAASPSIDSIVRSAMEEVLANASAAIARAVAEMTAAQLHQELQGGLSGSARRRGAFPRAVLPGRKSARPRAARTEITRWVADRNARRVPNFVIKMTGLDTKKKIVAKYGEDVAFEMGQPAPKAK